MIDTQIPTAQTAFVEIPSDYQSLVENAVEGIYRTTPDGRYVTANPALAAIYGYDTAEQLIQGLTDIAHGLYVDASDRDRFKQSLADTDVVLGFEARVYRKDGAVIWIAENARVIRDAYGQVVCYEGTVQDITFRKLAEDKQRLAAAVFESVGEAIMVTGRDNVVQAVNPAFERMTGLAADQVVGRPAALIATERTDQAVMDEIAATVVRGESWTGELWARRAGDEVFPASVSISGVADSDGTVRRVVSVCRDVTRRRRDEQRIRFQASHDVLTGLANRASILRALEDAVADATHAANAVVVIYMDVNRFKDVNDSFGHAAGDELLRQTAARLRGIVRISDVVGRLGGDEFVIVLPQVRDRRAATAMTDKIRYAFSDPFRISGRDIYASTSIGLAVFPDDGDSGEALLSAADTAMYSAKASGRPYRYYDHEMGEQATLRVNMENDLRLALERGEFRLVYQPKVDGRSGAVVGAEALIRWRHPVRGEVSPALFIPVAERAGLVGAIGDWSLSEACRQLARWRRRGLVLPSVSVNLSPAQFHDAKLPQKVEAALNSCGLAPHSLELEITETMMATEVDRAIAMLNTLRAQGIRLSIDDFGTGYSSLGYLKLFSVHTLKIDRAFVMGLPDDTRDGAIVASVVALAHNLGFKTIAEGVETQAQADALIQLGCPDMQGYLFSRPLPAKDFAAFLETRGGAAALSA